MASNFFTREFALVPGSSTRANGKEEIFYADLMYSFDCFPSNILVPRMFTKGHEQFLCSLSRCVS